MPAPHTGRLTIFPSAAVTDTRLGAAAFRVLAALGSYGDKHGWCFPALKTLAADLGVSKQAISKSIKQLVTFGYVVIKEQYRADGSRSVNYYRVVLDFERADTSPRQSDVDTPTPDVDTRQPSYVDTRQRNGVDTHQRNGVDALTSHKNDPMGKTHGKVVSASPRVTLATYQPGQNMYAWVAEKYPGVQLTERVLEKWRDHHTSRGTVIKNLDASLRTWLAGERPAPGGNIVNLIGKDRDRFTAAENVIARLERRTHGPA